jgi:hypothetical protein
MCWYCYWGLPRDVARVRKKALKALGGDGSHLDYGPAHIVWCDCNFDDRNIVLCLKECSEKPEDDEFGHWGAGVIETVKESLLALLAIPEKKRMPPEGWDNDMDVCQHFPPSADQLPMEHV